jgi:uncharacterized membrane protein YgdD (TMEM256/DUF423 family)
MWWRIGAVACGLSVALGAFGAHGLQQIIDDPHRIAVWETAARYQMFHGLAILLSEAAKRTGSRSNPWFLAGMVVFSGSLYALALSGIRVLGAITPIGGICFIIGWALLAWDGIPRDSA